MILISHRGNTFGPEPKLENNPIYIDSAIEDNYHVEIDVWKIKDSWFLGHDGPMYGVDESYLKKKNLLVHAKNLDALKSLLELDVHCFWHQEDYYTITSRGLIISYPGYATGENVICMKPELISMDTISDCHAICSDYVGVYSGRRAGEGLGFNETR
tara:strand:+ start:11371 stop:11841 length:471 start_codon:yes stop_codon:yes gene_type:complete